MSDMIRLTCLYHQTGYWLTKRIPGRSLHWIGWYTDEGIPYWHPTYGQNECPCPESDLIEYHTEPTEI